jgi:hypothetical protein
MADPYDALVVCLVGCCPDLQQLQIGQYGGFKQAQNYQSCGGMPGLTRLTIAGDSWAFENLSGLTQLKSLRLRFTSWRDLEGMVTSLRHLTALTQLSFLGIHGSSISDKDDAAIWDRVARAARLGVEAAGCNWAFVNKV